MAAKPTYEELEKRIRELERAESRRKRAEQALRESEKKLKAQYRGIPLPTYTWQKKGKDFVLVDHNDAAGAFTKGRVADFIGIRALEMYPDAPEIQEDMRRCLKEKIPISREMPYRFKATGESFFLAVKYAFVPPDLVLVHTEDITSRKRVEEARIQESDENYRCIFDSANEAIFVHDAESGAILDVNEKMLEMFGYNDKEEIIGKFVADLSSGEGAYTVEDATRFVAKAMRGEPQLFEWHARSRNGELFWVEVSLKKAALSGNDRVLALVRDITTRKRAEEKLLLSERRFRKIFEEISNVAVQGYDEQRRVTFWNRASERLYGYTEDDALGKKIEDLIIPSNMKEEVKRKHRRWIEYGEEISAGELTLKDKNGGQVSVFSSHVMHETIHGKEMFCVDIDLTPIKKAQEAFRKNEEKYRTILESIEDGYFEVDVAGNLTFFNHALCEMLGYSRDELMGMSSRRYTDVENAAKVYQTFNKVYTTEQPDKGFDWEIIRKDGSRRYVEASVSLRKDLEGRKTGFRGIARDVTERKQLDEALLESEERFRILSDASFEGVVIHDRGKILDANQTFARTFGYEIDEIVGMSVLELAAPEWRDVVKRNAMSGFEGAYEAEGLRKDGSTFPGQLRGRLIEYKGSPVRITAVRDLTEQKETEEALRESEEKLRFLAENMEDIIWTSDINFRTTYVSPSIEKMLGFTPEERKRQTLEDMVTPGSLKVIQEVFSEELQQRVAKAEDLDRSIIVEVEYYTKEGGTIWLENKVKWILDARRNIVGFHGVSRNISERKEAEEEKRKLENQLQQAQKMESIGTLAGGIAHDFNNLLMSIQGNASLMLLEKESDHPDYEKLKNIEQGIREGAHLTRQLLGFARGGKYESTPTDLNEVIKDQSRVFGSTRKEVQIHGRYQEGLFAVEADPGQIQQVLMNLYVNAWQAMPGGGDLYIQTENVTIDETYRKAFAVTPGRYVKIAVTDTGIGMDEKTQEKIFEPFFTTKEMGRGTGLGLASVYGIVKNHGGFINVYSEKGMGTTFHIYLPASGSEPGRRGLEKDEDILYGSGMLLLVDDEEKVLHVGEQVLRKLGYEVVAVKSGEEALDIYGEMGDGIAMVILDMIMPGMGGGEIFDRLKEMNPGIRVLLASGYSINGQAQEILARGCRGFIQKPFNMRELSRKIREVLDQGQEEGHGKN